MNLLLFLFLSAAVFYAAGFTMVQLNSYLWRKSRNLYFAEESIVVTLFIACLLACAAVLTSIAVIVL